MKIIIFLRKIAWSMLVLLFLAITPISLFLVNRYTNKLKIDFGLAIPTVNSLNYVKYNNPAVNLAVRPIVESYFKSFDSSNSTLMSKLQLPQFKAKIYNNLSGLYQDSRTSYDYSEYNRIGAVAKNGKDSNSIIYLKDKNALGSKGVIFFLNKLSKWRSGDPEWDKKNSRLVKGYDFVDSAKAILDFNNSSQSLISFGNLQISGTKEAQLAQLNYFKKTKKIYLNPFDGKLKKDGSVGISDFKLGVVSGNNLLDSSWKIAESQTIIDLLKKVVPSSEQKDDWLNYIVYYDLNIPSDEQTILSYLDTTAFLPINKQFILDHSGFEQFGTSLKNFIWNGPFDIEDLMLGAQGSILLKKSNKYYLSDKTIPNRIKLYFQEHEIVQMTLFEDAKISHARIPHVYHMKYWSDFKTRRNMKKQIGYGTVALQLNLDQGSNSDSPLQDENFRKAINYAIDREKFIKASGWYSTLPTISWTAVDAITDDYGKYIETYWKAKQDLYGNFTGFNTYKTDNGKRFPIVSFYWEVKDSKTNIFETIDRHDFAFDPSTARFYMKKYRQDNPNLSQVELTYIATSGQIQETVFIVLESFFKQQFGDFVKLKLKILPPNVLENFLQLGEFDIYYNNFDQYGTNLFSYINRFLLPDGIDKKNDKTNGFIENPAGSWTYSYYRHQKGGVEGWEWKKVQQQLEVDNHLWNKFNQLIPKFATINKQDVALKSSEDFKKYFSGATGVSNQERMKLLVIFEKFIHHARPIIPLYDADTNWWISHLVGVPSILTPHLQFAYDDRNKPYDWLPNFEGGN